MQPNLPCDVCSGGKKKKKKKGGGKKKEKQGIIWQLKNHYSSRLTDLVTNPALSLSLCSYSLPFLLLPSFSPLTPLK